MELIVCVYGCMLCVHVCMCVSFQLIYFCLMMVLMPAVIVRLLMLLSMTMMKMMMMLLLFVVVVVVVDGDDDAAMQAVTKSFERKIQELESMLDQAAQDT